MENQQASSSSPKIGFVSPWTLLVIVSWRQQLGTVVESTLNSNPHGGADAFSCRDFHPLQGLGNTTQDLQEPQIQQQSELNSWDPLLLSSCPRELTVKWK